MPDTKWNSETLPENDAIVHVLAADKRGHYELPFLVVFKDDRWWNARTEEELAAHIAGWRPLE